MGPGEGRLQLRGGEPAGGDQRRAEGHLGDQLGLVPLRPLGKAGQGGQQGLQVLDGLTGGAAAHGLHGRRLEVGDRPGLVVAGQEVGGQLGRVAVGVRPVGPLQPVGHGGVEPGPPAGRDAVVEHRPVQVVGEAEPRRHGPVRPGHRAGGPQEAAVAGQGRAAPLDRLDGPGAVAGGGGGGELDPAHGGRLQHGQVVGVQPFQLQLEQAAQVLGDLAGAAGAGGQLPPPGRRPQHAGVGPGLGELDDEQRHPVGAPVHELGQLLGDRGPGEPATQHRGHRLRAELAQPELAGQPPEPELGPGVGDRGAAGQGVGRPVGAGDQQPGRRGPPGQPGQQVDGRGIGPVQVLQDQHQRPVGGDRLQHRRRLPQPPLGRPAQGPALQLGAVGLLDQGRQLGQPGRGQTGQQDQGLAVVPAEPLQRVEDRQVGLGPAPLLEALAAGHQPGPAPLDLAGERLDQRRLADPGLAGHEHELAPPLLGQAVELAQPGQLGLPPDRRHRGRQRRRALLPHGGEELVAAAVDGADQPLLTPAVADRPAGRLDPAGQGRVAHEPAPPDLVQQLGPWHHPVAVADQVGQDLEHLRLQVAGDAAAAQLVAPVVELAVAEAVDHPGLLQNSSMPSPSLRDARAVASSHR